MRVNGNKNGKNKFEKNTSIQTRKEKKTHYHTLHLSDRIIIDERKKKWSVEKPELFWCPFSPADENYTDTACQLEWESECDAMQCKKGRQDRLLAPWMSIDDDMAWPVINQSWSIDGQWSTRRDRLGKVGLYYKSNNSPVGGPPAACGWYTCCWFWLTTYCVCGAPPPPPPK